MNELQYDLNLEHTNLNKIITFFVQGLFDSARVCMLVEFNDSDESKASITHKLVFNNKGCIIRIYTITPNKSILLNDRFASDVKNRDFATYFDKLLTRYQAAANIAICRGNGQCLYRIDREQAMLLQWCESE